MEKYKVLYISQEITPYCEETTSSLLWRHLPQKIQENGSQIRTFMPRYGVINERRNQLHEVIRLSGMNIIIKDTDNPLIIKVASIPLARMQVYFIDNEDYFDEKGILADENGNPYPDNLERALFFTKGILETIKKLRWTPDIIHCSGWITHLLPLYIRQVYNEDPYFANSKIIYAIQNDSFDINTENNMMQELSSDKIPESILKTIDTPNYFNTTKLALNFSDAVSFSEKVNNKDIIKLVDDLKLPKLDYVDIEDEDYAKAYDEFYEKVLAEEFANAN
ncbi:MAG: glycogen/starch synthase [Bacteroidales bacterium]|nr:glycogen/starch synthase [Bacteroidales bacterium]